MIRRTLLHLDPIAVVNWNLALVMVGGIQVAGYQPHVPSLIIGGLIGHLGAAAFASWYVGDRS